MQKCSLIPLQRVEAVLATKVFKAAQEVTKLIASIADSFRAQTNMVGAQAYLSLDCSC